MLVVQDDRINCWTFIYRILQIEEGKKEAGQKIRNRRNQVVILYQEKTDDRLASKLKSSSAIVKISKSNRCKAKKSDKRLKVRVKREK